MNERYAGMGEEHEHSRSGKKSFGERGGFNHRNGGKSGERRGGFHKDGFHKSGFKKSGFRHHDDERGEFRSGVGRDGERHFNRHNDRRDDYKENRHDGYRKDGFKKSGFRSENRDGERRFDRNRRFDRRDNRFDERRDDRRSKDFERAGEEGGNPRYKKFDGERRFDHRDNRNNDRRDDRRNNSRGGEFHKDFHKGAKGGFRDDRRDNHRDDRRDDERRFDRRDAHKDNDRHTNSHNSFRFDNGPRRNSDGTVSYPSQNPYTARRPGEPKMPKGLEWAMLSKEDRERLRGLSKEHAENIGLHILAAYVLEEENPDLALEHAKWAAKQASRIDFARETLAFVSYRQGDYKLAAKEFRTAMRMNGYLDYLPFIADCERGMNNLDKALEICMSDDAKSLRGEVKAEMFLVYAGVLADMNHIDKAIDLVHAMGRSKGLPGEYRMRAVQAEQYFLEEAGRSEDAVELESLLDNLEQQYADVDDEDMNPDDIVIDYDLEHVNDDMMDEIGVSEDDAQFAPEEDSDNYDAEDANDAEDASNDIEDEESEENHTDQNDADNTDTIEMSTVKSDENQSDEQ